MAPAQGLRPNTYPDRRTTDHDHAWTTDPGATEPAANACRSLESAAARQSQGQPSARTKQAQPAEHGCTRRFLTLSRRLLGQAKASVASESHVGRQEVFARAVCDGRRGGAGCRGFSTVAHAVGFPRPGACVVPPPRGQPAWIGSDDWPRPGVRQHIRVT